jgi:hypothetical protein
MSRIEALSETDQALVRAAVTAVENTEEPVREHEYRALWDPELRDCVRRCLDEMGRVLLRTEHGYTSGYADDVRAAFAEFGTGVLDFEERAVLILVLLHSVAIPRAKGRITGSGWAQGDPVDREQILDSKVRDTDVRAALTSLISQGLLRTSGRNRQLLPGPQLTRLTPAASARLWEELVLLAEPDGVLADVIRRRRSTSAIHHDDKNGE